jgi:hypothetical protein
MTRPCTGIPRRTRLAGRRDFRRRFLAAVGALAAALCGAAALAPAASAAPAAPAAAHPTVPAARHVQGAPNLGPNVYVFTPSMPQSQIQATVDAIASQQVPNQFGTQRYTLLFEPGSYGTAADPLIFQVGYYTQVAGLGASPGDVVINGSIDVYNQCLGAGGTNCLALDNFWRSMSNLTINVAGGSGCQTKTEFWAVSQAAPMRRVIVNGGASLMDYCSAGPQYASGGFIADSAFTGGTVVNGSQQQFFVRNSNLDGWSNGVWNQVFAGDNGAPAQAFGVPGGAGPYTTLATSPETQEEPFLYTDSGGSFNVFVPALRRDSAGPSWTGGGAAGHSISVSRFFIASPGTSVGRINLALATGRNLILTPGVYNLSRPIEVTRPDTVVLGLGFATLIPTRGNPAMVVNSARGVKVSGLIFDAGPVKSPVLLEVGRAPGHGPADPNDPTLVQDTFFRIGGAEAGQATDSLVVNSSDVILDDIWAWRADHGAGVGWTGNVAEHGLIVNGDNVTAYGLAVEHFQKTEVIWRGQGGTDIFFQNEMPYDPPSQAAWMADATTDGYPAFLVTGNVRSFTGYGLGVYCFFNQGIPIVASEAFQVPQTAPGVQLHDLLTVFLNGSGGINSVVDGTGAPVNSGNAGSASDVVSFP